MNVIAVDDEALSLGALEKAIEAAAPGNVKTFGAAREALTFSADHPIDVAFLDIDMPEMSGLPLALELKKLHPKINIIFVTGYSEYMGDAFAQHVSGYLLKPVSKEAVAEELENLRHPVAAPCTKRTSIRCFGNFEVFVDGEVLPFSRSKAKELLAYLIDRRGSGVRSAEISSTLWEDVAYTRSQQKQVQVIIGSMIKTLKEYGIEDIVSRGWNSIAIVPEKIDCDFYRLLEGEPAAINSYTGEYLSNYSWAEFTTGYLSSKIPRQG